MEQIVIAMIGLAGVIATATAGIIKVMIERRKLDQAENEIRFQRAALGFPEFVSEWGEIGNDLAKLMDETEIDRFMILRAWNGHLEPRWTTSVYQMRQGNQAPIAYIHWELDQDYINRIREMVQIGPLLMHTSEMHPCEIKKVYEAEGVTSSLWSHLDSFEASDGSSGKALAYCSFSTHGDDLLSEQTITRCRILIGRLKGLAYSFDRNRDISNLRPG